MTKYGRTLDVLLFTTLREKDLRPLDLRFYNPRTWGFFFLLLFRRACLTLLASSHPPCACPRSPEKHLELHLFCRLCTVAFIASKQCIHAFSWTSLNSYLFVSLFSFRVFLLFSNCHRSKRLVVSISMKIVSNNKRVSDSISCMLYICVIEKKAKRSWGFERAAKPIPRLLHNRTHPGSAWKGL